MVCDGVEDSHVLQLPKGNLVMTCIHLRQLYQLCETNDLKISGSDVVRIVCRQCDEVETCPAVLSDEYEAREEDSGQPKSAQSDNREKR